MIPISAIPIIPPEGTLRRKVVGALMADHFLAFFWPPQSRADKRMLKVIVWLRRHGWRVSVTGIGITHLGGIVYQATLRAITDYDRDVLRLFGICDDEKIDNGKLF